jgi:hypothetical protein
VAKAELGKLLLLEGVDGDDDAATRAAALLGEAMDALPGDAVVRVHLGSARLLEAKRAFAFWTKGRLAREGLALVDRAVADAPDDVEVRFIRGRSTYALPSFFRRGDEAASDLAWVAARAEAAVSEGRLAPDVAAAALFYDGVCRAERDDSDGARASWVRAMAIAPGSTHAEAARSRLASAAR